jgi:hypothetical protein
VREWLFRTMNSKLATRAFVQFVPLTNEVIFAHVSGDSGCAWVSPTACNNAWAYNRTTDTWAPIDLPNVAAMTLANVNSVMTYANAGAVTCDGVGGSYYDQEDSEDLHLVAVCAPLNTPGSLSTIDNGGMLLGYDFVDRGKLAAEAELTCIAPSFVERTGFALDQPEDGGAPLNASKLIRNIFPEVTVSRPLSLSIQFGGTMTASAPVQWSDPLQFDPETDYCVDTMTQGRYLAIRFTFRPMADTEVSGFDIDVIKNGSR